MRELEDVRAELDGVDRELVRLFEKRMALCREVARYKLAHGMPVLDAARDWLLRYFAGDAPDPRALPLAPQGSAFAREVWRLLLAIPYGRATSYGALAAQLAAQRGLAHMSAQAVGGAVGRNPIAIIIPCHRVLGAQGQLTGYAGGLAAKRFLLAHEGIGYRGSSNDGIAASHQREAGRDKG